MSFISTLSKLFASEKPVSGEKVTPVVTNESTIADNDTVIHQCLFDIDNYYQAEGIGLTDYDGDGIPDVY